MFYPNKKIEQARKHQVTIELMLFIHKTNKLGLHPVKLKVTFNRETKYYPVQYQGKNIFMGSDQWTLVITGKGKGKGELKHYRDAMDDLRLNAIQANSQLLSHGFPFTFTKFEQLLFSNETTDDFLKVFQSYLDRLFEESRFGTYRSYLCSYNALKAFYNSTRIMSPYDLSVDFLNQFEKYMRIERNAGSTTIGIYTRQIRTIYNICASKDIKLKEIYPFGSTRNGKYKIKDSRKGSKQGGALSLEQLKTLLNSKPDRYSGLYEAKMYWLFSFFCQGMNFKDICYLKYENINGGLISYTRQKTKRTEEDELLQIPITSEIQEIIDELGNENQHPSNYVFPIIDPSISDGYKIDKITMQKLKVVNEWLEKLSTQIGLPKITTYWSRHTYASLLKYSGVSVEMIRELLGHSDIRTTEHYLKRFDLASKRIINEGLFKNISS